MAYKGDIPILVNYAVTHDPLFKGFRLGSDKSHYYSDHKGVYFYIYDRFSEVAVGLKSFIKNFSIDFKFSLSETKNNQIRIQKAESVGIQYSLGLSVPALSVDDAMVNSSRMEMIQRFVNKTAVGESMPSAVPTNEFHYVLLSNLIHNGNYQKRILPKTADDLIQYGCPCYLSDFSFKIDKDFGFFEHRSKLWPKLYEIDFKLDVMNMVANEEGDASNYLIRSYSESGGISPKEATSGTWPFGVS